MSSTPPVVRFRILGAIAVASADGPSPVRGRRQLALLAFLLLHANRVVSTDQLIDALWSDQPATGRLKRLQVAVTRLRTALDGSGAALQTVGGGYLLAVEPGELDADLFRTCLRDGAECARRRPAGGGGGGAARGAGDVARAAAGRRGVRGLRPGRDPAARRAAAERDRARDRRRPRVRASSRGARGDRDADGRATAARASARAAHARPLPVGAPGGGARGVPRAAANADRRGGDRARSRPARAAPGDPASGSVTRHRDRRARRPSFRPGSAPRGGSGSSGGAASARSSRRRSRRAATANRAWCCSRASPASARRASPPTPPSARASSDLGVLYGYCDEELGIAYQPLRLALDQYLEWAPDELLERHVAEHGGRLSHLTPVLAQRVAVDAPPRLSDAESERWLLFQAVAGLLAQAAANRPLVLILDDLHWADRLTVALLRPRDRRRGAWRAAGAGDLPLDGGLRRPPAARPHDGPRQGSGDDPDRSRRPGRGRHRRARRGPRPRPRSASRAICAATAAATRSSSSSCCGTLGRTRRAASAT